MSSADNVTCVALCTLHTHHVVNNKQQITINSFISANHTYAVKDTFGYSQPLGLNPAVANRRSRDIVRTVQAVRLNITFGLYLMAIMSFVGWFLFAVFAGLGIPGIPIDMVRGFANRPQRLDRGQIAALELSIQVGTYILTCECYITIYVYTV
jgi:hypothetical protein